LTACGVIPSEPLPTLQPLPTEIPLPTLTPTTEPSPTLEATPTPTEIPVRDEWQVSADGRIFYNEATLARGLFTINETATQYTWDEMIRNFYQIQVAGQNRTFLRQFPNLEAFREYAASGRLVENMWIAIGHPRTGLRFAHQAAWEPVESVDLSTIALEFTYDTYEDVVSGVHDERSFINRSSGGGILFERVEINGRPVIRVTFHQRVMYDDSDWGILGFSPENYSSEHNLQSATQVVFEWFWFTGHMQDDAGGEIRIDDTNPPMFNVDKVYPSLSEYASFTQDLEHSPFRLR
jgi:hypothetical protein